MPEPTVLESPELKDFLKLANDDIRDPLVDPEVYMTTGAARLLALSVLDHIEWLDHSQMRGLVMFIAIAHTCPDKARELLEVQ